MVAGDAPVPRNLAVHTVKQSVCVLVNLVKMAGHVWKLMEHTRVSVHGFTGVKTASTLVHVH